MSDIELFGMRGKQIQKISGSHAPAWEQVLDAPASIGQGRRSVQKHSHAGAWEREDKGFCIVTKYSPYPNYTDFSGAWSGQLPAHWKPSRFKFVLARNDGGVWGSDGKEGDTPVLRSTEITLSGEWCIDDPAYRKLSAQEFSAGLLVHGDLLVTKSSGSESHIGKTALVDEHVAAMRPAYSNFMQRLRVAGGGFPRYFFYLLNNAYGKEQLNYLSSTTTGLRNLCGSVLAEIQLPGAPQDEQVQIATFLDNETARIDRLIEKQQQLIVLLKEKRQAVISLAVTKGLDPNVPMKESGVEWLGEVPEHWAFVRVKHLSIFTTSGPRGWSDYIKDDAEAIFLQSGDLNDQLEILPAKANRVEPPLGAEGVRTRARDGDVVVCITGANTGRVAVINELPSTTYINQHLSLIRFSSEKVFPSFAGYSLSSGPGSNHFTVSQYGLKEGLSLGNVAEAPIVLPPLKEQVEIVIELKKQLAELDKVVKRSTEMVVLLQERRTALISAAVTGKIDVRNHPSAQPRDQEAA